MIARVGRVARPRLSRISLRRRRSSVLLLMETLGRRSPVRRLVVSLLGICRVTRSSNLRWGSSRVARGVVLVVATRSHWRSASRVSPLSSTGVT